MVGDCPAGKEIAVCGRGFCRFFRLEQDFITEAQFQRLVGVHPRFRVHEVGKARAGKPGLDLIGIDDAFLDFVQQLDGLAHFFAVAQRKRQRIVDHHDRNGRHEHPRARHGDDRGGAGGNAVNLDGNLILRTVCLAAGVPCLRSALRCPRHSSARSARPSLIIHEHVVDLCRGHAISTGAVDPDCDRAGVREQLALKRGGRHVIFKPAFLGNRAFQPQHARVRGGLIPRPVPEFLHFGTSCSFVVFAFCVMGMGTMLPFTRYRFPPSSSDKGLRFSSSRMSLALIQPFCRAMA